MDIVQGNDFYEDDEPAEDVAAAFNAGAKGRTSRPLAATFGAESRLTTLAASPSLTTTISHARAGTTVRFAAAVGTFNVTQRH